MTFQNIEFSRVMRAIASIWGLAIILSFLISCVSAPLMPTAMGDSAMEYLETLSDPNATADAIEDRRAAFWSNFGQELTVQYILQWALVALAIFWVVGRTARRAESQAQAVGYGVMIAGGVALTYGVVCSCLPAVALSSSSLLLIAFVFLGLFVAAGYAGGRNAALNLQPEPAKTAPASMPRFGGGRPSEPVPAAGSGPKVYYNMGVQAALGGRAEEARQHFTRVLQMEPRNVAAWLQLANLADTPEQAWNYIQQARAIDANDPAVREAVAIIWPQVAASAEKREPPRNQPPYPGGQQDDTAIPHSRLPGSVLDAAEKPDSGVPGDDDDEPEVPPGTPLPPPPDEPRIP